MSLPTLAELDKYKAAPFVPGYPDDVRTFYAPVDDVHGALIALLQSAAKSLVVAMYGFDDDQAAGVIHDKLRAEHVHVQLTLDSSQAGGVHERRLLAAERYPASSVAVGRSEHGAIMHMKVLIIDGVDLVTGSTNWSLAGEQKQDNELTVHRSAERCAEARARIDAIHANMLQKAT